MYVVIEAYKLPLFLDFESCFSYYYTLCVSAIPTHKVYQLDDMYQGSAFNVYSYQQFILHKGIYMWGTEKANIKCSRQTSEKTQFT